MTAETPTSPSATDTPKKRTTLIIILVVVGVLIAAGIAVGVWRVSSDDSGDEKGVAPGQTAKALFRAWQDGNQVAAARVANQGSVTYIFAVQPSEGSGLEFGGCSSTGDGAFPKECVWSRPGGELTMTLDKVGDKTTVTEVDYGPAGLPPDTDATG